MSRIGYFQRFIKHAFPILINKHPYISKLKESLGPNLPKSSSLNLGISPLSGKNLILNFQHSDKSWEVGQFTININVNDELLPAEDFCPASKSFYKFQSGFYRIGSATGGRDRWWCLKEIIPDVELYEELTNEQDEKLRYSEDIIIRLANFSCRELNDKYTEYWHPTSYSDEKIYFTETALDVSDYIKNRVLVPFGYE